MTAAIRMHQVVKRYGRVAALDGLDFEVPQGSVFGLVGSNGAGKTTALAALAGLLRVQSGRIDLLGDGPFDPRRHAGRVSLLPQDAQLPDHSRVRELLMYYGSLQGIASGMLRDEVDRRLEEVHLSDRARHKVRTLSHGMRRRLTIAQALLGDPELVLLDEPMNGLDPREVANTRRLLHARRGKQTLVISSHLLTEVEAVCDHVAFMENGKRVRQGTLAEIVRNKHQITYHLESGPIPRKELEAALPGITVSISEDGHALCLGFARATLTTGHVNAVALPILLRNDVVVLEVRRGSSLEHEYLESRSGGSAKPHPPCPDAIG